MDVKIRLREYRGRTFLVPEPYVQGDQVCTIHPDGKLEYLGRRATSWGFDGTETVMEWLVLLVDNALDKSDPVAARTTAVNRMIRQTAERIREEKQMDNG